jgi:hypothetical protein
MSLPDFLTLGVACCLITMGRTAWAGLKAPDLDAARRRFGELVANAVFAGGLLAAAWFVARGGTP